MRAENVMTTTWKPKTVAAQMAGATEPVTQGVVPPVHVATTFIRDPDNQYRTGFSYGRPDNATVRQTEAVVAALEGGDAGLLFGSGMAAASAVVLALDPGAHILAPKEAYWGLRNWISGVAPRYGYRVDLVDMSDLDAVRRAVTPDTRLIWIETPSNPLWGITDIAAVAEIACGRRAPRHRLDRGHAGADTPTRPRRRHRHAFGDQVPQRPFRRGGGGADRPAWRRVLAEDRPGQDAARRDPGAV